MYNYRLGAHLFYYEAPMIQVTRNETYPRANSGLNKDTVSKENAIRSIVRSAVKSYANGFSTRHLSELDDENGVINMKIHNVFIAALGKEIQYYSALARSLDSSLGNMLESMAISIAELNYKVSQHVEGTLYKEQTDYIAELLEQYKRSENRRIPKVEDYHGITNMKGTASTKRHESGNRNALSD